MSTLDYYEAWLRIKQDLQNCVTDDEQVQYFATTYVGVKPQSTAIDLLGRLYGKSCELYNKLCDIYDQTLQPQRSEYLKKIIDAMTCRIIELKSMLEEVECLEYTYPDNALQQMFMVPENIEIMCPFFYPFEIRRAELQYVVDEILAGNRLGDPEPTPSDLERRKEERLEMLRIKEEEKQAEIKRKLAMGEEIPDSITSIKYTPEQLAERTRLAEFNSHILNLQRMIRTRKIIEEKVQHKNKEANQFLMLAGLAKPEASEQLQQKAAHIIKHSYRVFMKLKRDHVRDYRLRAKLGMIMTSWAPPSQKIQLEKVKEKRREYRREYFTKWLETHVKEKSRIFRLRQHDIMEDISDEIRGWMLEWYKGARAFDEYPWPLEGGSILIVRGETFTVEEYLEWVEVEKKRQKVLEQNPKTPEDIKAEKKAAKEEKRKAAAEAKEREAKRIIVYKKMRPNPETDPGVYYRIGKASDPLQESWKLYENTWHDIDSPYGPLDAIKGHIMRLILENVQQELQYELRPIVDEIMMIELGKLRVALKRDLDLIGEKMPLVKKRKKPKKPKKVKEEKTAPEVLFQRLVDAGIVIKYPKVTLEEYWGDQNYAAAVTRAIMWTPRFSPPCIGDVKQLVRVRCLLTIGCECPGVPRAHLIAGPKYSGKKTLIYAVATETNSILMDLSPMNVYNKFPGPKGMKQMFALVNKVARIMQPTIIMVENADKLFYKKVPKEEKMFDPTRLSGDFFKEIIKPIKTPDKMLIIGTATEPWNSKHGPMSKVFPNVILLPNTDYGSLVFILQKLLMKYHGVNRNFNVHSLAQTLRGYDIKSIKQGVSTTLNSARVAQLSFRPLEPMEVINSVLSDDDAVCTEPFDYEFFNNWYSSYSKFGERFNEYIELLAVQLEMKLKLDEKNKKNKKK